METTVFLISYAEIMKGRYENYPAGESLEEKMEKTILSPDGEAQAKALSCKEELQSIDVLYSSSYVRTLSTAKYLAYENNLVINIEDDLKERVIGRSDSLDGLDFYRRQEHDFDYKLYGGESLNQVKQRMSKLLKKILWERQEERIAIVSHNTAILALLSAWCEEGYNLDERLILTFKGETIVDGAIANPTVFKLTFEGENIRGIEKL